MKDIVVSVDAPSFSEGLSPCLVMPVSVSPKISVYAFQRGQLSCFWATLGLVTRQLLSLHFDFVTKLKTHYLSLPSNIGIEIARKSPLGFRTDLGY